MIKTSTIERYASLEENVIFRYLFLIEGAIVTLASPLILLTSSLLIVSDLRHPIETLSLKILPIIFLAALMTLIYVKFITVIGIIKKMKGKFFTSAFKRHYEKCIFINIFLSLTVYALILAFTVIMN